MNIGLLGELQVEQRLVELGWHPVRLDTAQMAINADLLAIKRKSRIAIQVKTTDAISTHSHSGFLGFGYATNHLRDKTPVFNSKASPLLADVIVGVSYRAKETRFVVLPVALAEKLCTAQAKYWYDIPRGDGERRTTNFPIYLCLTATRGTHVKHHEQMKRNLLRYEDKWDVLSESIDRLHNPKAWPTVK